MLAKLIWPTSAITLHLAILTIWFTEALHLIFQVQHAYELLLHIKELAKSVLSLTWSNILEIKLQKRRRNYTLILNNHQKPANDKERLSPCHMWMTSRNKMLQLTENSDRQDTLLTSIGVHLTFLKRRLEKRVLWDYLE